MTQLPARTGWDWLKQGMALFRKQPAALTTLLFANTFISLALSAVPYLGAPLAVILMPFFSMAFMQACLMIENGARVTPAVLLTGFRQPVLPALGKIGLIYLAVSLVLMLLLRQTITPEFLQAMTGPIDPHNPPRLPPHNLLAMFGLYLLYVASLMALCFTAPLACWKRMAPGKATFYSFFAVVRTARAFLVLMGSWFALFLGVCMVAALVFGDAALGRVVVIWLFFLCVLLLQCAMYAGYREIFGKPAELQAT